MTSPRRFLIALFVGAMIHSVMFSGIAFAGDPASDTDSAGTVTSASTTIEADGSTTTTDTPAIVTADEPEPVELPSDSVSESIDEGIPVELEAPVVDEQPAADVVTVELPSDPVSESIDEGIPVELEAPVVDEQPAADVVTVEAPAPPADPVVDLVDESEGAVEAIATSDTAEQTPIASVTAGSTAPLVTPDSGTQTPATPVAGLSEALITVIDEQAEPVELLDIADVPELEDDPVLAALAADENVQIAAALLPVHDTPQNVVTTLVGSGVTFSNVAYIGSPLSLGTFTGGTGIIGFESGIILGTGDITGIVPNGNSSNSLGGLGDVDLEALLDEANSTYDATVLTFDFVSTGTQVEFKYVFSSIEYPEYVNAGYDDVFGFFIDDQNCATIGGQRVSVDSINENTNSEYFIPNYDHQIPISMDGFTTVLTCTIEVQSGQVGSMKLAIADTGDYILDSNIFLQAQSFTVVTPTPEPSPTTGPSPSPSPSPEPSPTTGPKPSPSPAPDRPVEQVHHHQWAAIDQPVASVDVVALPVTGSGLHRSTVDLTTTILLGLVAASFVMGIGLREKRLRR